ncbi:MAG: indolepyruvate ferredoxin oxidoreductase family protein [Cycloclasticus sp.]|uniref:indolepyruvate ferredoxin oxidoreductase family protein n=1 Tax=Cycloclasticus sp. TaxID=2024830 RepID=UPI00257EFA9B|nr:indolepyruvate ferredoxin oxidoreductase family protein [Cycloclasticus sp.]MBV1898130.1 indolepyruvate ferredoxin oxidoreductase family protein [Cycloclasticus sp.]
MSTSKEEKFVREDGPVFLSGNQAYLRLAFEQQRRDREAGLKTGGFISGYRGSPFGNFDTECRGVESSLNERDIHFNPGVNEAMAATAIWGSQQIDFFEGNEFDGAFGLWYGKGPGVDQAADALHHANLWGTSKHGGVVMAVGDDPMSRSSSIQQQSEYVLSGLCIPIMHCSSVQDIYDFGLIAYQMSRYSGVWVAVKSVSDIAESWYMVDIDPKRTETVLPDSSEFVIPDSGVHTRWPDRSVDQDERIVNARLPAVKAFTKANKLNKVTLDAKQRRVGIITAGKSYLDTLEALDDLSIDESMRDELGLAVFKIAVIWPMEESLVREFAESVDEILVIEESRPFLETQVKDILFDMPMGIRPLVMGKKGRDQQTQFPSNGELTPALISKALVNWLKPYKTTDSMTKWIEVLENTDKQLSVPRNTVERTPYFCSGCPHSSSTKLPDDSSEQLIGIGCHFLVGLMDRKGTTYTQMGGEGATWAGASPFLGNRHTFVNLGDGTFYHSGSTAIRQAIASNINITYKILFNDAVAMTGGQSFDGPLTVEGITQQMHSEGAARIVVVSKEPEALNKTAFAPGTDLYHRNDLQMVMKELADTKGVTILVFEQTCATELRRRRKRKLVETPKKLTFINSRVCEGCGDCGVQSNCLSVQPLETELGRKRVIDQSGCNLDFSCVKGFCPSFVTIEGGELAKGSSVNLSDDVFAALPEPTPKSLDGVFGSLVCGIGGTGVVTISSMIGEAAKAEGFASQVLDLTGMAQKFGAVYCHLKVANNVEELNSTRLSIGKADLLIGADIVTSASDEGMSRLREGHTKGVVNSHGIVTGAFTRDGDFSIPVDDMKQALERFTGKGNCDFFDSTKVSETLTGNTIGANMMLLGFACQKGWLPVKRQSLEDAITANGVAVAYNQRVFKIGRLMAHDPDAVKTLLEQGATTPEWEVLSATTDELISRREADLVAYQSKSYAKKFTKLIDKVREAEAKLAGDSDEITQAAARYLYKLMAYKDELEVARLYTDGTWANEVKENFSGDYKIKFHMAPPLISKRDPITGQLKKREFGGWMLSALKVASKFKGLRHTPLNPFGYSAERKEDKALLKQYKAVLNQIITGLTEENKEVALEMARVPEFVRGYGHVRTESVEVAEGRWKTLDNHFNNPMKVIKVKTGTTA